MVGDKKISGRPKEPIKARGRITISGWDIPVSWCIDADNKCWKGDGLGDNLRQVKWPLLESEFRRENDHEGERAACKALGLEVPWPNWARQAKAAGWTPPENWKP